MANTFGFHDQATAVLDASGEATIRVEGERAWSTLEIQEIATRSLDGSNVTLEVFDYQGRFLHGTYAGDLDQATLSYPLVLSPGEAMEFRYKGGTPGSTVEIVVRGIGKAER